jgi:aspartyl aminopeptidase
VYLQQDASFERAMTKSLLISADMAHACHPNYPEKHEDNHRPAMNKGVVIKQNANQRYATTSISTLLLRQFAKKAGIPLQEFVVRNDSPCGSTVYIFNLDWSHAEFKAWNPNCGRRQPAMVYAFCPRDLWLQGCAVCY